MWILVASHEKLLTAYFAKDGRISGTIFYYFWQITKKEKEKKKNVIKSECYIRIVKALKDHKKLFTSYHISLNNWFPWMGFLLENEILKGYF